MGETSEPDPSGQANSLPDALLARPEALTWIRAAFRVAPVGVTVRDQNRRLVWANPSYEELVGKSLKELIGQDVNSLVVDGGESTNRIIAALEDKSVLAVPGLEYQHPDGSIVYVDLTVHRLEDENGVLDLYLSFAENVTDRHHLKTQLALDTLVANLSAQLVEVDVADMTTAVSDVLADIGSAMDAEAVRLLNDESSEDEFLWTADGKRTAEEEAETLDVSVPIGSSRGKGPNTLSVSFDPGRQVTAAEIGTLETIGQLLNGFFTRLEAQLYFNLAFDNAPVGISLRDEDSTLLAANRAYADFLGYGSADEMIGQFADAVVAPVDGERANKIPSNVSTHGIHRVDRMKFIRKDGTATIGRVHARRVAGISKEHHLVLSHIEDLSASTKQQQDLEISQQRFRDLVENSPAITVLFDANLDITYASPSVAGAGWSSKHLIGRNIDDLPDSVSEHLVRELRLVMTTLEPREFDWASGEAEEDQWFRVAAVPEFNADGGIDGVIMVGVDDTARRHSQARLVHEARHDLLTGLANRSALVDHLSVLLDLGYEPTLLFLDIDRFKVINDSLGHRLGDQLLADVAARLDGIVRDDCLVARFGGDEFVMVLDHRLTDLQSLNLGDRIKMELAPPFYLGAEEVYVTVSIGIAYPRSDDLEELISDADSAMYRAKGGGRNRTELYDADAERVPAARIRTEAELRHALPERQLESYLQAEVSLETGELLGAEALVRWNHPTKGLLAAASFMEIAEECGLITDIGHEVLKDAVAILSEWQNDPKTADLTMRVNMSARQLSEHDMVERVEEVLRATGAKSTGLCLEITETAIMADAAASLDVLHRLRALGLTLAIDDFGTGYSSLSYLKRFPLDVLKIDRSFVDGLPDDGHDSAIVDTIIKMAGVFSLDLVAEGVETQAQADALLALGCQRAQGYYFGRPIPRSEFESAALFPGSNRWLHSIHGAS